MIKSGLLVGAGMFVLVLLAAAVISPLCALCIPLLTGLGAGYLAGNFDKPLSNAEAAKRGAGAGAISSGLGLVAQALAAVLNGLVLQNPQFNPGRIFVGQPIDPSLIWAGQIGIGVCVGLVNVGLSAGFGAGGGAIWWSSVGKNRASEGETVTL